MRFVNKHVMITGAARGIGYEIAKHFGNEGAVLSLIDNHRENLADTARQFRANGFEVYDYAIDISDRKQVDEAGGGKYQSSINEALREYIARKREPLLRAG